MNNIQPLDDFYSLEKHLEVSCNKHPQLKLLESQWRFDQELISKALQNVSSIFPHCSRHDASHSRQIIVNIERMLGDDIKKLTATDTWLILESAYNHDIGMVITQKQIEDMNSLEFQNFVEKLSTDEENELASFAKNWLEDKAKLPQKAKAHEFFQKYLYLLAEWYRVRHPENSAKIVRDPVNEIGLNSARNELLPKRLFNSLADICKAHGDDFEDVKKLPKSEAGMATEDCHPLYVACLLRMGDLLDIDDNRFCPVMLSMCGHNLPSMSKNHLDKHHAIKHFRLDSQRIEIECVCSTPESYEIAYSWFTWLQSEYHNQTQYWDKIAPENFGRLPTLMTPAVDIQKPYLLIQKGEKPKFSIDNDAVLKLVRGTGLYNNKFDSIREILQNAVDSTLHRIWIEHKKEIEQANPTSEEYRKICDQYKIDVQLFPKDDSSDKWILKVKDKGIGISFNDLSHMLKIGSSSKNNDKQKRLRGMPMWFRPSGAFGIGIQSAFLLSDSFTIFSHSMVDNKKLKINISRSSVVIEEIDTDNVEFGCEFYIEIPISKNPKRMSMSFGEERTEVGRHLFKYDFTDPHSSLEMVEVTRICASISHFFKFSTITSTVEKFNPQEKPAGYFDSNNNLILKSISFSEISRHPQNTTDLFRGQPFSGLHVGFPCVNLIADFYHTTSDKFLTYNREKILSESVTDARELLRDTLKKYIEQKFDNEPSSVKPFIALTYISSLFKKDYNEIDEKFKTALKNYPMILDNNGIENKITFAEVLEKIKTGDLTELSILKSRQNISGEVTIIANKPDDELFYLLKFLATKDGTFYQIEKTDSYIETISFSSEDGIPIAEDIFKKEIETKCSPFATLSGIGCRMIFPAWGEFRKISINQVGGWHDQYRYTSYQSDNLVLPINFSFQKKDNKFFDQTDKFNLWVYENRKNKDVSLDEVKKLNAQLIEELKTILDTNAATTNME